MQLLRARIGGEAGATEPRGAPRAHVRQAFVVSLTNPKVMLFFVSFFPLFMKADASPVTLVAMMLHVTLPSLACQSLLVLAGNRVAQRLKALPSVRRMATRAAGVALPGFGIRLAIDDR